MINIIKDKEDCKDQENKMKKKKEWSLILKNYQNFLVKVILFYIDLKKKYYAMLKKFDGTGRLLWKEAQPYEKEFAKAERY